jgi:hypothetical protein
MAKIYLDRLKEKYGFDPIKKQKYSELVKSILLENTTAIQKGVGRITKKKFENFSKRYTTKETRLVIPEANEILPKRSVQLLKATQNGQLISDTLRDRLTGKLRERLLGYKGDKYVKLRGTTAGRINPDLIKNFQDDITDVFTNYTKRNPKFGVPNNIKNIAVTEARSAITTLKDAYTQRFIEVNPDYTVWKTWIHNPSFSKTPRKGHGQAHGKRIPYNDVFKIKLYDHSGKYIRTDYMKYPHDPGASGDQNIGCNCDLDISIAKKRKRI